MNSYYISEQILLKTLLFYNCKHKLELFWTLTNETDYAFNI